MKTDNYNVRCSSSNSMLRATHTHKHMSCVNNTIIDYFHLLCLFSLFCRYRPAYKAFRDDSSFNFMVFFFIFFFQLMMLVWQTLGVRGSGYCGFFTALHQFDGTLAGVLVGLVTLVIACSFAICVAGNLYLLTKVKISNWMTQPPVLPTPSRPISHHFSPYTFRFMQSTAHRRAWAWTRLKLNLPMNS